MRPPHPPHGLVQFCQQMASAIPIQPVQTADTEVIDDKTNDEVTDNEAPRVVCGVATPGNPPADSSSRSSGSSNSSGSSFNSISSRSIGSSSSSDRSSTTKSNSPARCPTHRKRCSPLRVPWVD